MLLTSRVLPGKVIAVATASVFLALSAACVPAATPTSTPPPSPTPTVILTSSLARLQEVAAGEPRLLTVEAETVESYLWWSQDGSEFVVGRALSYGERPGETCGAEYLTPARVWRVKADGTRQFLAESLDTASASPDGRYLLYVSALRCEGERFVRSLTLLDLRSGARRPLAEAWGPQRFSPWLGGRSRAVIVARRDGLWSVETGTDKTHRLIQFTLPSGFVAAAPSPDGQWLAYVQPTSVGVIELWLAGPDGSPVRVASGVERSTPAWFPDGSRVAYFLKSYSPARAGRLHVSTPWQEEASESVFSVALDSRDSSPGTPAWSPDGRFIAVPYVGQGPSGERTTVHLLSADGSETTRLASLDFPIEQLQWAEDGRSLFLVARRWHAVGMGGLWALPLDVGALAGFPSQPVSVYVRARPDPVAPNLYVYLEPERVPEERKLAATPGALAQEGVTLVRTRQELERAVGAATKAVVVHREGADEVDPSWLRDQRDAGRLIFALWMERDELGALLASPSPIAPLPTRPVSDFAFSYVGARDGHPSLGGAYTTLPSRLMLYWLMSYLASATGELQGGLVPPPPPTPTAVPTPILAPTPTPTPLLPPPPIPTPAGTPPAPGAYRGSSPLCEETPPFSAEVKGPGQLRGNVCGLPEGEKAVLEIRPAPSWDKVGDPALTLEVGNGLWELSGLDLPPGHYRLVVKSPHPDLPAVPGGYGLRVPEQGVLWRYGRLSFEFVWRQNAVERFGYPLCEPPTPPQARGTATPTPTPTPWPGAPVCAAFAEGFVGAEWAAQVAGTLRGLRPGDGATISLYRLSLVEGRCYWYGYPGAAKGCVQGPEAEPLDAMPDTTGLELVATFQAAPPRWGLTGDGVTAAGRYLLVAESSGYAVTPSTYAFDLPSQGKVPSWKSGLDFDFGSTGR